MAFSPVRIISGFGLPAKYGSLPVALVISAATEPVAGSGPSADGTGLVGVGADEPGARVDQPDGLGQRLEAVRTGLAEDHIVRLVVFELGELQGVMERLLSRVPAA